MNRVTVDPTSDQNFVREIIRKLPLEVRGILICDHERPVSDFAAKVAEIMIESGYIKLDSSYKSNRGNGAYADRVNFGNQRFPNQGFSTKFRDPNLSFHFNLQSQGWGTNYHTNNNCDRNSNRSPYHKRIHRSWAVFVVDDVIVYFLSLFNFPYHFLSFSCYWRWPVPYIYLTLPYILPSVTLPYLISYLLLPYLTLYLIFCYLTLPYILPSVTLPYLTFCLTLPYVLPFVTLPYLTFYLTLPYLLPYILPSLTLHLNLPYLLPYILPYLTSYLTLCFALPYLTLSYILPYLTSYLSSYLTLPRTLPYLTFRLTLHYLLSYLTFCLTLPYLRCL